MSGLIELGPRDEKTDTCGDGRVRSRVTAGEM
jgi:hypothetical protein